MACSGLSKRAESMMSAKRTSGSSSGSEKPNFFRAVSAISFVHELYARAGRPRLAMLDSIFAVHPGGPKIIDAVRDKLELDEAQVAHSRAVLRDHGNMSSATLPHVWMRLAEDRAITDGALIASIAFGPGLTLAGALFEKRS